MTVVPTLARSSSSSWWSGRHPGSPCARDGPKRRLGPLTNRSAVGLFRGQVQDVGIDGGVQCAI